MADFEPAIEIVLKHEGGFVDNLKDPGGATNFGITTGLFSGYLGVDSKFADVKYITEPLAKIIYRKMFWDVFQLDNQPDQALANIILDLAVLRGTFAIQNDLDRLNIFRGSKTIALGLIMRSQLAFSEICVRKPDQLEFLETWLLRTHDLLGLII